MLKNNCCRRKTHKNKFPFTLSGILECKECGEKISGASATGGTGRRVRYYEHLATKRSEASIHHKLLSHKPRRIPAGKIEPLVWIEVKKFVTSDAFAKDMLMSGKSAHGRNRKIPYYEHAWATKHQAAFAKKINKCDPHRLQAEKIEPLVWQEVKQFLSVEEMTRQNYMKTLKALSSFLPISNRF